MKSVLVSRLALAVVVGVALIPAGDVWAEEGVGLGGSASHSLNTRFYATLMGGGIQTDNARELDDMASTIAIGGGWQMNERLAVELLYQYDEYKSDSASGAADAELMSGSVRGLIYPTASNVYAYVGLGYGQYEPEDDAERNYDSVLWSLGAGYASGALELGVIDLMLRAELGFRGDMHSGSQTTPERNNSFNELTAQLGVLIPFGARPEPAEEANSAGVSVVPVSDNPDLDGDGVENLMDACPGTAKGAEVDMLGCAL